MKQIRNIIGLISTLLIVSYQSQAQQLAQYTLNSFNKYALNPAIAGTEDFIDIKASYRTQWVGLDGAPTTSYFSFHMPIGQELGSSHNRRKNEKDSWFGIGSFISNDVTGPSRRLSGYGTVSYNVPLNQTFRASLGVSLGLQNYRFDGSEVSLQDNGDALFDNAQNQISPDGQIGLWLYSDNMYFGLSSQQLFNNQLDLTDQDPMDSKLNRHYFVSTGFNIPVSENVEIYPSALLKLIEPAPASLELGIRATYQRKYWLGMFARAGDSFSVVAGALFLDAYSISYGYDINYSDLSPFNTGSHEIMLGFRWPPKPRIDCPSNFWN